MIGRFGSPRDPFEGRGAVRRQQRVGFEGFVALLLAIGACGMTSALWMRALAPLTERLLG
jgi:hypothetical protein